MKRVFAACALLLLVVLACFGSSSYIRRISDRLTQETNAVIQAVSQEDFVTAEQFSDQVYTLWRNHSRPLSCLTRHNEIDETERLFQRMRQAVINHDRNEALSQLRELRFLIGHFPEMDQPDYSNLF